MIPSIHKRGSETIGLIKYLYGPGTDEVHIDPHLVAAFDPLTPDPGRDPKATYEQLEHLLDQPVNALPASKRPEKHVWHLSVRAAPEDPILSDEDWAAIARRMVAATGIAPDGDEQACRWAAVRHADDHIHIIATLVRDDGRRPRRHNEARRAQAECRRIEVDYGLRRVPPGDGTAAKRPTSAELHKAEREGRERAAREELRETARRAVAGATSEEEFFDRLAAAGLLIRKRVAPSGDLLGYKVALPDNLNGEREPVFYAGYTLSPDLSLPRIRKRFSGDSDASSRSDSAPSSRSPGPAAARRSTATAAWQTLLIIDHGEDDRHPAALRSRHDPAEHPALHGAPEGMERLTRTVDDLDDTIKIIRSTIFGLRTHSGVGRESDGLRGRVAEAVSASATSLGFPPALRIEGLVETDVPGDIADHAVAVLGEALSNAARHSGAQAVDVRLQCARGELTLTVTDDGCGVPGDVGRSGLKNIKERAVTFGGTLTLGERPEGGGTRLVWRVPVSADGVTDGG